MKNFIKFMIICSAGISLTACGALEGFDKKTEAPYALERTAQHEQMAEMPAPAAASAPIAAAPMCTPCEMCDGHKTHIAELESELAACKEASSHLREAYSDTLKK